MPKWLVYSLIAFVVLGVWGVVNTPASQVLDPLPLQAISTLGLLPVALVLLFSKNLRQGTNIRRGAVYAFGAGLTASLGNVALSAAITSGGQTSIILPLSSVFPLVTVLLARIFLKERLNVIQTLGLLCALGALVVSGVVAAGEAPPAMAALPWFRKVFSSWMVYALLALLSFGVSAIFQKLSVSNISNELSTVFFTAAFVTIGVVIVTAYDQFTWKISAQAWTLALTYGALIGMMVLALFAAYRRGKASVVTALTSLYPALTVVLAVPLLGESLDGTKIFMIVLALAAGLALTYEKVPAADVRGSLPA